MILILTAISITTTVLFIVLLVRWIRKRRESFTDELKMDEVTKKDYDDYMKVQGQINPLKNAVNDILSRWNEYIYINEMKDSLKINYGDKDIIGKYFEVILFTFRRATDKNLISASEANHDPVGMLNISHG